MPNKTGELVTPRTYMEDDERVANLKHFQITKAYCSWTDRNQQPRKVIKVLVSLERNRLRKESVGSLEKSGGLISVEGGERNPS